MPYTVVQYTAAEVEQILKEHAATVVGNRGDLSKVTVEFTSNTTGSPASVSFTRANVTMAIPGPRKESYSSDIRESGMGFRD